MWKRMCFIIQEDRSLLYNLERKLKKTIMFSLLQLSFAKGKQWDNIAKESFFVSFPCCVPTLRSLERRESMPSNEGPMTSCWYSLEKCARLRVAGTCLILSMLSLRSLHGKVCKNGSKMKEGQCTLNKDKLL